MKNRILGYFIMRLIIGVNLFVHGLVRLPKLQGFSHWMVKHFEKSMLPTILVKPFSLSIPFIELIIGLLLILGLKTEKTILAALTLMLFLVFGSCITETWDWAAYQMIYGIFLYILLVDIDHNDISLDNKWK